jgi:hypothetical protein
MKPVAAIVLIAVALIFTSSGSEAQPGSLTDIVEADLRGEYQSIKSKIHRMKFGVVKGRPIPRVLDLGQCDSDGFLISGVYRSDALDWLVILATSIETRSNNLRAAGFPPRLWEPVLGEYESAQIASAARLKADREEESRMKERSMRVHRELAATLNAYRRTNRALPRVIVEDDCGGSGTTIYVLTQPPGGSVYFIPSFYYDLCVAKNLNPEDRERCNRWEEPISMGGPGPVFSGSGEYMYLALWGSGRRKGKIDFDKVKGGVTLTISPGQ